MFIANFIIITADKNWLYLIFTKILQSKYYLPWLIEEETEFR